MKFYTWCLLSTLLCFPLSQTYAKHPTFGHNLISTTETLPAKQFTVGTYFVGYGVSDQFNVVTNTWLLVFYNMLNVGTRYAFTLSKEAKIRLAFDAVWFKTEEYALNWYRQHSVFARATASKAFSETYELNVSFGYQYYFNRDIAFSLRPVPVNDSETTLNFGTLHEFKINDKWGVFFEAALLGLNYPNKYFHTGLSGYYSWGKGLLQLGFSRSIPFGGTQFRGGETDAEFSDERGIRRQSVYFKNRAPFHPECKLQFYF